MSSAGDKRPPPDRFFWPLDRVTKRRRFQSNSIITNPRSSYRIKRVLIHMLRGHVFELITDGIFYAFLNIYKI